MAAGANLPLSPAAPDFERAESQRFLSGFYRRCVGF